ncbi:MAG: hypothetical protein ACREE7_01190 [Dongiaceae bacterium]
MATARRLGIGDVVPPVRLVDLDGQPAPLQSQDNAGRMLVLLLCRRADAGALPALHALADCQPALAEVEAQSLAISGSNAAANRALAEQHAPPFALFADGPDDLLGRFGAGDAAMFVVLDAGARVAGLFSGGAREAAAKVVALCRSLYSASPAEPATPHAPVLLVPQIFDALFCHQLVQLWQRGEKRTNETSRGAPGDPDYQARRDSDVKRRSDVLIPEGDNAINLEIRDRFLRRVVPNIQSAFQTKVRSYEVARIGCYDASSGGYFRAHRDDVGDPAMPRRFAMSVNLNDDFDGGGLRFPEFGRRFYRPEPGTGVVFSCSLLHEALPVTRGRRFGLFTFFR